MKLRNLIAMLPVLAAYSCTFDESGLSGGRKPIYGTQADARVYTPDDGNNRKSKDKGPDSLITKKEDSGVDSGIQSKDAGRDSGNDARSADLGLDGMVADAGRDSGVDAPYSADAGVNDLGRRDEGLTRDLGRDLGAVDVYRPDMGRDAITIFPDIIIIRPFDLGSDARDGSLDLGADGLSRDLGLDGMVADAGRDLGPDGPVLPRPYECDESTVALYHFDQPEPFVDSCRNHHLTNNGTTESSGEPGFGQARNFNGTRGYLSTPSTDDLNFGDRQDFRIRANIRTTAPLTNYDVILGKTTTGIPNMTGYAIFYYSTTGWSCIYWDRDRTEQAYSLETLNDGLWHEIVCERSNNGTRATIYVDGVERRTTAITPANTDSSGRLLVGNMEHGIERNQGYFEGEIDGVEIERIGESVVR